MIFRAIIGVATGSIVWLALVWSYSDLFDTTGQELWLLALGIVPGIGVGLVTNSGFRLWHELVRQGEAVRLAPRILAGLTGLVLRPVVVVMFMCCLIVMIPRLQRAYYWGEQDWIWPALLCAHFAAGVAVLFARLKTALLFPLALIANVPVVAALVQFHVSRPDVPLVALPYLGVWAVFLLTRWRQTDLTLGVVNEEIHYYLID